MRINNLERFYGDETLGNLLRHSKSVVDECRQFQFMLSSENAEEMLHCLTNVLLRLHPSDKLQHLTQNQEAELLGWDAEKYRKSIQR